MGGFILTYKYSGACGRRVRRHATDQGVGTTSLAFDLSISFSSIGIPGGAIFFWARARRGAMAGYGVGMDTHGGDT